MSGGLLLWIIVLLCWSMSSQLITCTFSLMWYFCWYFLANEFQNAAVWFLEYSAATSLMDDALAPDMPLPPPALPLPVPPPQAVRPRTAAVALASSAALLLRTSHPCNSWPHSPRPACLYGL